MFVKLNYHVQYTVAFNRLTLINYYTLYMHCTAADLCFCFSAYGKSRLSHDRRYELFEPRHEKTGFLHMQKNKATDQLRGNCEADQGLCFRYIDSTIPLLSKSKISSL